jgi:hypothetical protein
MKPDLHTTAGKIEDLRNRLNEAVHAGSESAIDKQHAKGKMTARERVEKLVDAGALAEKLLGKKLIELGHLTEEELDLAANLKQRKRYRRTLDTSAQKEEFDKKISADVRKILGTIQTQSPS